MSAEGLDGHVRVLDVCTDNSDSLVGTTEGGSTGILAWAVPVSERLEDVDSL